MLLLLLLGEHIIIHCALRITHTDHHIMLFNLKTWKMGIMNVNLIDGLCAKRPIRVMSISHRSPRSDDPRRHLSSSRSSSLPDEHIPLLSPCISSSSSFNYVFLVFLCICLIFCVLPCPFLPSIQSCRSVRLPPLKALSILCNPTPITFHPLTQILFFFLFSSLLFSYRLDTKRIYSMASGTEEGSKSIPWRTLRIFRFMLSIIIDSLS